MTKNQSTHTKAVVREAPSTTTPKAVSHADFPEVRPLWVPKEGQPLMIELPGERLMTTVAKVMSPDTVIVELTAQPLAKTHNYSKGDFVPCERANTDLEVIWRAFVPKPRRTLSDVAADVKSEKEPLEVKPKRKRNAAAIG